jgi:DNA-directed RNA polymerase I, II, and III subunit RPABC3
MSLLFQDIFDVQQLNPEGKKFERVNRLMCKGLTNDMSLLIDINCEIYRVLEGEKLSVALASTLAMDGSLDDGTYKTYDDEPSLLDQYDYAMHGQIFEFKHAGGQSVEIYASFGGLLMRLTGDQRHMDKLVPDMKIYCLIRKSNA